VKLKLREIPGSGTAPSRSQVDDRLLVKSLREAMPRAKISPFWPYMVRLVRSGRVEQGYALEMVSAINEAIGPVTLRRSTIRRFDPEKRRTDTGERRFVTRCSKLLDSNPRFAAALSIFEETLPVSMKPYVRIHYLGQFTILLRMVLHELRP